MDERLFVNVHFYDDLVGWTSTGGVCFGMAEARREAEKLRQWVRDNYGAGTLGETEITPDTPRNTHRNGYKHV